MITRHIKSLWQLLPWPIYDVIKLNSCIYHIIVIYKCKYIIIHNLGAYHGPTGWPSLSWPDSSTSYSTAPALQRLGFASCSGLNFSGISLPTAYCSAPNCQDHFRLKMLWHTSSEASNEESNWVKSCSKDLRQTLARTLSLPLCGIPMMMLSTPSSLDLSIIIFIAGIKTSQPSIPKRFSELHFLARKASNLSWKETETKLQRRNWEDQ